MRKILTGAFAILSLFATAQTTAQARAILDDVKENLLSYSDQSFDFTSTIEIPTGNADNPRMTRESSGSVVLVGQNYKVETQGQIAMLNGNRAYIIVPDDREVTVRILEDDNMAFTPNGVVSRFESGSSLSLAGNETIAGKNIQYIRVRPNGDEEIRDLVLGVDMATKRISSFTEYGTNDVITKYVVSNYRVNQGLPASAVEFNRAHYDGWRINEPRSRRRR